MTPYHSQTNGRSQSAHATVTIKLSHDVNTIQNNWDIYLPDVQFAYNSTIHASSQYSPYLVLYGHNPKFPFQIILSTHLDVNTNKLYKNVQRF